MGVKRLYEFGPFLLDPAERVLTREGRPVPLTPKAFDLLVVFVENGGHLLGKKDLMEAVWPDSFVEEGNLTFTVSSLRKALGEDRKEPQYIETVPRSGYRFVADVRVLGGDSGAGQGERDARPGPGFPPAVESVRPPAEVGGSSRLRKFLAPLTVLVVAAAVAAGLYAYAGRGRPGGESVDLLRGATVARLTTTRNAVDAAISPDGKYVVYVVDEARQRSLWLRQVATNSHAQVIAPSAVLYLDMFFSRDSEYVYYV